MRKSLWRRTTGFISGRLPPFAYGFAVGDALPVFRFPDVTTGEIEPALRYLAENRYHSVTADVMAAVIHGRKRVPARGVALLFDGCYSSLWLFAFPLLKQFGLRAVAYAIPGRVIDAAAPRPTAEEGPVGFTAADTADCPFCTWPELREMSSSGWVDVQSNTWSHSLIFTGSRALGALQPSSPPLPLLSRPRVNAGDPPEFLATDRFGYPLFRTHSRMSDSRRYLPDAAGIAAIDAFLDARGRTSFFARSGWQRELAPLLRRIEGTYETPDEQRATIAHELAAARETLEARLGTTVKHVSLPWNRAGRITREAIVVQGLETAVAHGWRDPLHVRRGDDPFRLGGLPPAYIFALPGHGRRVFRGRLSSGS